MDYLVQMKSMTAMKITKEFVRYCEALMPEVDKVLDDDPIYQGYYVMLADDEYTIAPNAEEFFEIFEFVGEETPGQFAPIKRKD